MDRIDAVWDVVGNLTYAEMVELANSLRDAGDCIGMEPSDANSWAQVIECARQSSLSEEA